MKGLKLLLRTLRGEFAVGLTTGLIAFGIGELLLPHNRVLPAWNCSCRVRTRWR